MAALPYPPVADGFLAMFGCNRGARMWIRVPRDDATAVVWEHAIA